MIATPVRVKDALKSGMYKKNYRVLVLNNDETVRATLDNNNLIKDSVKIDERMCSGDNIKFGLCEGTSLEFQYFGYKNINGKRVKLMLDVEYLNEDGRLAWYEMPMGYFNVDSCSMQFSTGIRKATCYNKLKSAYLDKDVTDRVNEIVQKGEGGHTGSATIDTILYETLKKYAIEEYYSLAFERKQTSKPRGTLNTLDFSFERTSPSVRNYKAIVHYLTNTQTFTLKGVKNGDYFRYFINKKSFNDYFDKVCSKLSLNYTDHNNKTWKYYVEEGNKVLHKVTGIGTLPSFDLYDLESDKSITTDYIVVDTNEEQAKITISYVFYVKVSEAVNKFPELYSIDDLYRFYVDEIETERAQIEGLIYNTIDYLRFDKRLEKVGSKIQVTTNDMDKIQNVTLRDMQSSLFEMNCQFGRLDRNTDLFAGLELNNNRLVPSDTLYPSNDLYPTSNSERTDASAYEKLWTDSVGVQKFKNLVITYSGLDSEGKAAEFTLERTVNSNGTLDYIMDDNWLFKNLTWTEEQIAEYADVMVEKMRNISWFPFEMWCAGLPYLEAGDELEISNSEGTYTSYILQRQLKGIQKLSDTFINGELDIF